MLFSVEQVFVGRDEIGAPLKTPAWEATVESQRSERTLGTRLLCGFKRRLKQAPTIWQKSRSLASEKIASHCGKMLVQSRTKQTNI